jgi:uncharacterized membrane protein
MSGSVHNPALRRHAQERAKDGQNRAADRITAFAGSMPFVYLHIVWFAGWIIVGVEGYPFGLLTMIVSLEAIFLTSFVMISQNRADTRHQILADQQWETIQDENHQNTELLLLSNLQDRQNRELIEISQQILALSTEIRKLHARSIPAEQESAPPGRTDLG